MRIEAGAVFFFVSRFGLVGNLLDTPPRTGAETLARNNLVNGIREFACSKGASVTCVPSALPEMRVDPCTLSRALACASPSAHNLFAYPAQSNFTGVQHLLDWIAELQKLCRPWYAGGTITFSSVLCPTLGVAAYGVHTLPS
jgi:hypothetical protein